MGDTTGIEWTDHTFNPWWGCVRVSPACEHCYAETFAARFGVQWGVKAERKPASEKVWAAPLRWNRAAEKAGVRARVFCASMADVFEDRRDLDAARERLFALIEATPWLDWQLLTKRPEAVMRLVPERWKRLPPNVWIGTTVEDQRRANERIPHLLQIPADVRFLSCEPLLGPVNLHSALYIGDEGGYEYAGSPRQMIDWVIVGGESGPGARPMRSSWARSIRDQCAQVGVGGFWRTPALFFKQWGDWAPRTRDDGGEFDTLAAHNRDRLVDVDGNVHCTHDAAGSDAEPMSRIGKHRAGSMLDGVSHKAFPA